MPITDMLSRQGGKWATWGFTAASVVVHAGLLGAVVMATSEEAAVAAEPTDEEVTFVDIREFAPPPPPSASGPEQPEPQPTQPTQPEPQPQPAPEPVQQPPTPRATDLVDPVDSLPDPLGDDAPPEPVVEAPVRAPPTGRVTATRGEGGQAGGVEGGVEGGREGGVVGGQGEQVPEPGGTYIAAVVDREAQLTNRGDLPRMMQRLYPDVLRDAGIGARVVVQFVVDTNGRVDMGTVKIMSSSHDGFGDATRQALREFRFRPAQMGSRKVRMLTQLPIVWEVQ